MIELYKLLWLFFCYSFLGWLIETAFAAVKKRAYEDRGVLFGPLCPVYGITGLVISFGLQELAQGWFFLFLFGALWATVVEWVAGHLLEKFTHTRWWDYSGYPVNLDGYICLGASVLWGVLGVLVGKIGGPLLLSLFALLPALLVKITLWVLVSLLAVDILGTVLTLAGVHSRLPQVDTVNNRLAALSVQLGHWILSATERRMVRQHPGSRFARDEEAIPVSAKPKIFAAGCSFYKIVLLFFIGAFLGDITETIFCRITAGVWMSRSSVVWGPFSIVWGLAIAMVTQLLYKYRDKSALFLFTAGTLLGGAYEYLCSVFTERVFGTVFWDYSKFPLNLGGRVNLLYSCFWGLAAIAWFKLLYPKFSGLIERLPVVFGTVLTWGLLVFMAANVTVSTLAQMRANERAAGLPAETAVAVWMDTHYSDAVLKQIYPNAKRADTVGVNK